ncbi:Beta-barrel assembly machine subunit BamC [Pseudomonas sp. 8Z]|uniref:outer membrane protein assembly factor BamC n=1 Tax=Pseudomonas sp. 8Z TaxID=2653166 RepID=UPI0012F2D6F7|nr:outer membrane protein assembly factor BamC [Pseudomonas sp. 8Z]VXC29636.1 Beta-barrel assembly machine subunit BamC [Pseudomonas sp. 8Z]
MKRLAGFSALALIISSTSGCGWLWGEDGYFRDRGSDYLEARQTAPMKLPADVDAKRLDPLLPVPAQVPNAAQTSGEFEVPRPMAMQIRADEREFSLQNSGDSRWIVAQRVPAEVWPLARQFFEDNGFRIAEERPQVGEFTTTWQRFDELSANMARQLSSRVSDVAADAETRVRVRIEPGVQRNTSEVFIASAQRPAGSSADVAFADKANSSLESALLDEMLVSMARSVEQGGSVSLLAARDYDAPSRVSLSEDGNGNPLLNLGADFDRAWSSVGRSLELADIRVDDLNRSLGVYYINLAEGAQKRDEQPGFFSRLFGGKPSKEEIDARAERYQVRLTTVGDSVQVTVDKDLNTVAPSDTARRILSLIQDNLG